MATQLLGIFGFVVAVITLGYTIPQLCLNNRMLQLTIDSLNISRKALDEAIRANWLAMNALEEAIYANRIGLMQLCLQNMVCSSLLSYLCGSTTHGYTACLRVSMNSSVGM